MKQYKHYTDIIEDYYSNNLDPMLMEAIEYLIEQEKSVFKVPIIKEDIYKILKE